MTIIYGDRMNGRMNCQSQITDTNGSQRTTFNDKYLFDDNIATTHIRYITYRYNLLLTARTVLASLKRYCGY